MVAGNCGMRDFARLDLISEGFFFFHFCGIGACVCVLHVCEPRSLPRFRLALAHDLRPYSCVWNSQEEPFGLDGALRTR